MGERPPAPSLTRRDLLKLGGVAVAAGAAGDLLGPLISPHSQPSLPFLRAIALDVLRDP